MGERRNRLSVTWLAVETLESQVSCHYVANGMMNVLDRTVFSRFGLDVQAELAFALHLPSIKPCQPYGHTTVFVSISNGTEDILRVATRRDGHKDISLLKKPPHLFYEAVFISGIISDSREIWDIIREADGP